MIRVNWTRMTLEFWKQKLEREKWRRVLEEIGSECVARIESAGPLEWLPAEDHVRVAVAPAGHMRPQEFRDLWRQMTCDSFKRPVFRVMVEGALRIFNHTPGDLVRFAPRGWTLVSRGTGDITVAATEEAHAVMVTWAKIPPLFRAAPDFALAWQGSLDAITELAGHKGSVTMDASQLSQGAVRYTMRW
jgi:hypothetical protein